MFERFKALRERMRDLAEVAELRESDLADLGLTREQMRSLVTIPADVSDRMTAMAAVFGISPEQLTADRSDYVEMLCNCSQCKARSACASELAKGAAADPARTDFCVNHDTFAQMAPALTASAA